MSLQGQSFVVVGGTSGIGLATAKSANARGANVHVIGRDLDRLASALEDIGAGAKGQALDAADRDALEEFFAKIGDIDHLVMSASGARGAGALIDLEADDLRAGFEAKFWVQWNALRAALAHLRPSGSVTFVTAASARMGNPGTSGLAAINGALNAMVLPLARELAPVRVNAVSPGVIDTPWWAARPKAMKDSFFESVSKGTPAGRVGRPAEVAEAIIFLATNDFITGVILDVDGGLRTSVA